MHIDLLGFEQNVLLSRFCFWWEDEGGREEEKGKPSKLYNRSDDLKTVTNGQTRENKF